MNKRLPLLALLLVVTSPLLGQTGIPSEGREYFLGILYPSYNRVVSYRVDTFYSVYANVTSQVDNTVTISYCASQGKEVNFKTYSIAAHHSIQIPLDKNIMKMMEPGEVPEYKSCHLVARSPVTVEYFSTGANSGGSYLPLPVQCLGKNYVVESYHDNTGGAGGYLSAEDASGYFLIIAVHDDTNIEIVPNSTTMLKHPGVNCGLGANGTPQGFAIFLHRGECYMVKSKPDNGCNISGSTVVSDKPIAVIAGNENGVTDGSDGGTIIIEQRDFMVEQMIPVEYWDTNGYISIPFIDGKSAPGGDGDELQFFYGKLMDAAANYPKGSNVNTSPDIGNFYPSLYPSASSFKHGVVKPVRAFAINGAKLHVVQYDQRMHGANTGNLPSPSQLSIIPMSCWKNTYQWCVPPLDKEQWQFSCSNIICSKIDYDNDSVLLSVNGSNYTSLRKCDSVYRAFPISNPPNLIGVQVKLKPGSYSIKDIAKGTNNSGYVPLVVYNYGSRGLGIFGGHFTYGNTYGDQVFSYANPTGMLCRTTDIPKSRIKATITPGCGKWSICISDSGSKENGIRYIELLNYLSSNTIAPTPQAHNIALSEQLDSLGKNEIILDGTDTSYCFDVFVKNLQDSARLSLAVYDNSGEQTVLTLPSVPSLTVARATGSLKMLPSSVFAFRPISKDTTQCGSIVLSRPSSIYTTDLVIDSIFLLHKNLGITLTSTLPKFPVTLKPDDSIVFGICFTPQGKYLAIDSIAIRTASCGNEYYLSIQGQLVTGKLLAADIDFGGIFRNDSLCKTITLVNTGSAPFQLKDYTLSDTVHFIVSSPFFKFLPFTLDSGESVDVTVCFYPADDTLYSSRIDWLTDIGPDFIAASKLTTNISGRGNAFDITWTLNKSAIVADSLKKPILVLKRYFLRNKTQLVATVNTVSIAGTNADEFTIASSEKNTLSNFSINANDSTWFDVAFVPDISRPYPDRYVDRKATLNAMFRSSPKDNLLDSSVMQLVGTFNSIFAFGVHSKYSSAKVKAYIRNGRVIIEGNSISELNDCSLYDLLGRKVKHWNRGEIREDQSSLFLSLPRLPKGLYVLKLDTGEAHKILID